MICVSLFFILCCLDLFVAHEGITKNTTSKRAFVKTKHIHVQDTAHKVPSKKSVTNSHKKSWSGSWGGGGQGGGGQGGGGRHGGGNWQSSWNSGGAKGGGGGQGGSSFGGGGQGGGDGGQGGGGFGGGCGGFGGGCGGFGSGCGGYYRSKVDKNGKTKREFISDCPEHGDSKKRFTSPFAIGGYGMWPYGGMSNHGHYDFGSAPLARVAMGFGEGHGIGTPCGGCGLGYKSTIAKDGTTKRSLVLKCKDKKAAKKHGCFADLHAFWDGLHHWGRGGLGHGGFGFGGCGGGGCGGGFGGGGFGGCGFGSGCGGYGLGGGFGGGCGSGFGGGCGLGGFGGFGGHGGCGYRNKITKEGGKTKRELVYSCPNLKDAKASKKHFGGWYGSSPLAYTYAPSWGLGSLYGLGGFGGLPYGGGVGLGYGGAGFGYGGPLSGFPGCYYRSNVAKGDKTAKRHMVCDSPIAHAPFAGLRNRFNAGFGPYTRGPWWGGYATGVYPGLGPYSYGVVSKSKVAKGKMSKKCGIDGCGAGGLGYEWGGHQGPSGAEWGHPGSGFGTYPPRFPWVKSFPWTRSQISKNEKGDKNEEKNEKGEKRGKIPKSTKKQTIHMGYGYASGDNYRLGFGFGGMGGLDPFQTLGSHAGMSPGTPDAQHVFGRSHVPRQMIGFPGNAHGHFGGVGGHFGGGHFGGGHGMGPAAAGHPVTHPGFSTMAYPHAVATVDVKKGKVPTADATKRQGFGPLTGQLGHPEGLLAPGMLGGGMHGPGMLGHGGLGVLGHGGPAGMLGHGPGMLGHGGPGMLGGHGLLGGHGPGLLGGHGAGHGHFPGHPITHPGFSTLGYPGHAMATLDIKNKIPKKNDRPKRQAFMGGPVPHFMVQAPAAMPMHGPMLAGYVPAMAAAPMAAPVAMGNPMAFAHPPMMPLSAMMPQMAVPISAAGPAIPAQAMTIPIQHPPGMFPFGK